MATFGDRMPVGVRQHLAGLRALLVLTLVLGVAYPLVITGIAQLAFHGQANGSLISARGGNVGSSLLGQNFTDDRGAPLPRWFQPRPSNAGDGYDPTSSGASNLGPENPKLVQTIVERRAAVAAFEGVERAAVPPDAVTSSGSGLDPHISPAYAYLQVNRIARVRGLQVAQVRQLVSDHLQGRPLGFLGEPRVNVVELNLALPRLRG